MWPHVPEDQGHTRQRERRWTGRASEINHRLFMSFHYRNYFHKSISFEKYLVASVDGYLKRTLRTGFLIQNRTRSGHKTTLHFLQSIIIWIFYRLKLLMVPPTARVIKIVFNAFLETRKTISWTVRMVRCHRLVIKYE